MRKYAEKRTLCVVLSHGVRAYRAARCAMCNILNKYIKEYFYFFY